MRNVVLAIIVTVAAPGVGFAQIIFSDNFDDGNFDGWSIKNPGPANSVFEVVDGELRMAHTPSRLGDFQAIRPDAIAGVGFQNGIVSFDVTIETGNTSAVSILRESDPVTGYVVGLGPDPFGNNSASAVRFDAGQLVEIPGAITGDFWVPGKTYHARFVIDGPDLGFTVTDKISGESWSGSGSDDTYSSGGVALSVANSFAVPDIGPVGARFDNFVVEAVPEPSSAVTMWLGIGALYLLNRKRKLRVSRSNGTLRKSARLGGSGT